MSRGFDLDNFLEENSRMFAKKRPFKQQLGVAIAFYMSYAIAFTGDDAQAQLTSDTTLGAENTVVTPNVVIHGLPSNQINGGATRGSNLFHSFKEFNIAQGRGVYFTNPAGIENILARVTGINPSNIKGTLGVTGGNANLVLINPNGIIFGKNSRLDLNGSFIASTASSLVFADGSFFSTTAPQTPSLLTINVPIGLQYSGNGGNIQVEKARLQVPNGETLALVGGNVNLDGTSLLAPEGRVELGGVAGAATVGLNVNSNNLHLSFPDDVGLADIALNNKAVVDVSGQGGGAIQFQGRQVTLTDESKVSANTLGDQDGQGIAIRAVELSIQGGTQVTASTSGEGNGGTIDINTSDLVELSGTSANGQKPSKIASDVVDAAGTAGNLTITTRRLIVQNGARISASASGTGQGGNVEINSSDSVQLIGTSQDDRRPSGVSVQTSRGTGDAGNLTITTNYLLIQNGAEVSAATFGEGQGGTVEVNASDLVELSGTSANGLWLSRLFAGTGKPSDVKRDGNLPPAMDDVPSLSTGNGGNLSVKTRLLTILDGAQISVDSQGLGVAGNLEVKAGSIEMDNGKLIAQTLSGQGGNITLRVQDLLLMHHGSKISGTAGLAGSGGNGGNITISTPFIVAIPKEDSDIRANAFTGNGGKVQITASGLFGIQFRPQDTPKSDITASSTFGINGTVQINTLDIDPSRGLAQLPSDLVDATGLIDRRCTFSGGVGQRSRFTVTGRGGLPPNPDGPLNIDAVVSNWVSLDSNIENHPLTVSPTPDSSAPRQIVEAQGWIVNENRQIVLTAKVPKVTPQGEWLDSAKC